MFAPELALAFVAGLVTLLNPCVLPLLPIVIAGAFATGRLGPAVLGLGLALSFTVFGLLVTTVGFAIGLTSSVLRNLGAGLLVASGLILLVPVAQLRLATAMGPISGGAGALAHRLPVGGLGGQFLLGGLLGAIWGPCVGPTLGAAIGAAAQGQDLIASGTIMLAFGLGTACALTLFAYGSRHALARRRARWSTGAAYAKPTLGAVLIIVGLLVMSGLDKRIEAAALTRMPTWLVDITTMF